MHRVDKLMPKIATIMSLNDGALTLANRSMTMTSTFNNLLRAMIDIWPSVPLSDEQVERLFPAIQRWTRATDAFPISRELLEKAMAEGLEPVIPFLIVRFLLRNHHLPFNRTYMTPEFSEFISIYQGLFDKLKIMEQEVVLSEYGNTI